MFCALSTGVTSAVFLSHVNVRAELVKTVTGEPKAPASYVSFLRRYSHIRLNAFMKGNEKLAFKRSFVTSVAV